jgi:hypothetical protein
MQAGAVAVAKVLRFRKNFKNIKMPLLPEAFFITKISKK